MKPKTTRCFFTILLNFFLVSTLTAQEQQLYSLKGSVVDSASHKPLEYATVILKTTSNKAFKSSFTSAKGEFVFQKVPAGDYQLNMVLVGYKPASMAVKVAGTGLQVDLGRLKMTGGENKLKEVTVTADRPLIKQEIDRISYDVQADPESKVNTVLDMLRKVPLVSVDADDNIQVKGGGNYKVLINGRPSSLVARDPKEVFKSMPASSIERIELITTPPAKYDSEGLAGIINIITNKKIDQGMNGSLSARYESPSRDGANGRITLKEGKFGITAMAGINNWSNPATNFSVLRTLHPSETDLLTSGRRNNKGFYNYSNAELSYEFDTLNLITAEFGYNTGSSDNNNLQFISQDASLDAEDMSYRIDNAFDSDWNGFDLGLNYQLGFKRSKDQLLTGSYKFDRSNDGNFSEFLTSERMNYPASGGNYAQRNESGADEQTIQVDYLHPVKKLNVEGGLKLILRDNFSDFEYGDYNDEGDYVINEGRSNKFNYEQNVYSFYNSYQLKLKNWGIKAGLRLERTVIDADFVSLKSAFKGDYNNFIPSVSLQRKFKKNISVNLGYTQRIQRPNIWQLNPYEWQLNENFIRTGNTDLQPVLVHNFDLNFSIFKKGTLNAGISHSFANNTIQYVNRIEGNVSRMSFENIGKDKNWGFNISTNQQFTSKFNVNVNGRISYIWLEGTIDNKVIKNDGLQGNLYAYAGYKLKKDFRLSANAGFYSAWVTLQGQSNPYYYSSLSLSKEFLKQKLNISGSVSNPFQKFRSWENSTSSQAFTQTENFQNYYRNFRISASYKFGKLKGDIKKNRRGINNDDVAGKASPN